MEDQARKMFKKFFPEGDEKVQSAKELKPNSSDYVGDISQPYDRLRKRLNKLLGSGFPPIVCDLKQHLDDRK